MSKRPQFIEVSEIGDWTVGIRRYFNEKGEVEDQTAVARDYNGNTVEAQMDDEEEVDITIENVETQDFEDDPQEMMEQVKDIIEDMAAFAYWETTFAQDAQGMAQWAFAGESVDYEQEDADMLANADFSVPIYEPRWQMENPELRSFAVETYNSQRDPEWDLVLRYQINRDGEVVKKTAELVHDEGGYIELTPEFDRENGKAVLRRAECLTGREESMPSVGLEDRLKYAGETLLRAGSPELMQQQAEAQVLVKQVEGIEKASIQELDAAVSALMDPEAIKLEIVAAAGDREAQDEALGRLSVVLRARGGTVTEAEADKLGNASPQQAANRFFQDRVGRPGKEATQLERVRAAQAKPDYGQSR